jgi:putative effector of murein hydrolase LrgA (UPF0299 family)
MKMNMWRRIELVCGIGCGVLGLLPFFLRHGAYAFELFRSSSGNLLDALLLFFLPGLLVGVGSYFHAVRTRTFGLILLLVGGVFLTLMMLVHFFSGAVFYLFGLPGGLAILMQGLLALIAMISLIIGRVPAAQQRSYEKG